MIKLYLIVERKLNLIVSIGAIWDAFSSPTVGYLSDHRDPRED